MALMEWRCTHQAFKRGVQPAITNSPTHLLTKQKNRQTEKKKDKASITINLDYRRNCYNTRLLGYSQIIVTPATTDTATTTTTILAWIAQTQTNTDKEKDGGSVRISTYNICFHMPHCWLSCA